MIAYNSKRRTFLLFIQIVSDISLVMIAWVAAYCLRFFSFIPVQKGIPQAYLYLKLLPFLAVIWFVIFALFGFYRRSLQKRSAFVEALDIFQSCFLATLSFIAFTYFYNEYVYSRVNLIIFALLHPWFIIAGRSFIRKILRIYRRSSPPRGLIIIGSGNMLEDALQLAKNAEFERTNILGIVLIGSHENLEVGEAICKKYQLPRLDQPKSWVEFFSIQPHIQTLYFALPYSDYRELDAILPEVSQQIADVRIIPDIHRYSHFRAGIDLINGCPVITLHDSPLHGFGSYLKRASDIFAALLGLIFFAPLMALLTVLVKLSSAGPVFYRQERMGLDGKTFDCLKFRSMPLDSEDRSGPVWATKGEDRATAIGKFMRRYSLDELPQLINVLRGDMSIVGPRPERPVFVQKFRAQVPGYMLRHKAKAGITGWAQVNGWRGDTSIEKRIEFDLYYIQNWTLWLDIKIMLMTIHEVFFSKNAY